LGRSNLEVSALGLGGWAIGGPFWRSNGESRERMGWGEVDDEESVRAIYRALELGVTFFDTANNYGCGHSERVLGRALAGRWREVVIATKFASVFDEESRTFYDNREMPMTLEAIREACIASLNRLGTDCIDLYQFHDGGYDPARAGEVRDILEELVTQGLIRYYGWSTDDPERARIFALGEHCAAVQHRVNLFYPANEMLALCEEFDLASINKSPLASGFLTGKFNAESQITDEADGRRSWNFREGRLANGLVTLEDLRGVLTSDGRTMAQAALGWIWAHSERTVPIPGFKNRQQVEDNAGAMAFGPLGAEQMRQVEEILGQAEWLAR
jgi:aryl-alcohol dehydrogenase-like predicted oxidoreductase